jgi:hypothetical protein
VLPAQRNRKRKGRIAIARLALLLAGQRPSVAITQADNTAAALTGDAGLAQARAGLAADSQDLAGAAARSAEASATEAQASPIPPRALEETY